MPREKARKSRSRGFVGTFNNPSETALTEFKNLLQRLHESGKVKLAVGQLEQGEEGTSHIQFYVEYKTVQLWDTVRTQLSQFGSVHLEPRKGSPTDAYEYVTKQDTAVLDDDGSKCYHFEFGSAPKGCGARSDLDVIADAVLAGGSEREIAMAHPSTYIRCYNGVRALISQRDAAEPRMLSEAPRVTVLWGVSGGGKSHYALELAQSYGVPYYKLSAGMGSWFEAYAGQETIILDEFCGNIQYSMLKEMLDKFPMRVPCKNGSYEFRGKNFIIMSNTKPWNWYKNLKPVHQLQLQRRITAIEIFTAPYDGEYHKESVEWHIEKYTEQYGSDTREQYRFSFRPTP